MAIILTFGIMDYAEQEIYGAVLKSESNDLTFDKLKEMIVRVREHSSMRDKFDLPMASEEVSYAIESVKGVPVGVFSFRDVTRNDWAEDAIGALIEQYPELEIMKLNDEILAEVVDASFSKMSAMDITGPWKGIYYVIPNQ